MSGLVNQLMTMGGPVSISVTAMQPHTRGFVPQPYPVRDYEARTYFSKPKKKMRRKMQNTDPSHYSESDHHGHSQNVQCLEVFGLLHSPIIKKNEFQPNNLPTIISCSYSHGFVGPHTVLRIPTAGSPLKK